MPKIILENISTFGKNFPIIQDLNLTIDDKSFVTLLGPANSHKTEILRIIAGLDSPNVGKITIDDQVVFDSEKKINIPASERNIAYLYKNCTLSYKMNVYQNIAFDLSDYKKDLPLIDVAAKRADECIKILSNLDRLNLLAKDCINSDGKLLKQKLSTKLVDEYLISMISAKAISSLDIYDEKTQKENVEAEIKKQQNIIDSARKKCEKVNQSLDENFQYVENGNIIIKKRKYSDEEIDLKVREIARKFSLNNYLDCTVNQLNDRQKKSVFLARLLTSESKILLIDDPMQDIESIYYNQMNIELQRIVSDYNLTAVMASQSKEDAIALSNKIAFIQFGKLIQYDTVENIYKYPQTIYVASYLGFSPINLVNAKITYEDNKYTLLVFNNERLTFKPNESIDEKKLDAEQQQNIEESRTIPLQVIQENGKYKFPSNKVEERLNSEKDELDDTNVVVGVRPKSITITKDGKFYGEIFAILNNIIYSQVVIRIGNYLLSGIVVDGVKYSINQHIKFNVTGDNIMIFDKFTQKLLTTGSIVV